MYAHLFISLFLTAAAFLILPVQALQCAGKPGTVPEITAIQVEKGPVIDGKLEDDVWRGAAIYGSVTSGFLVGSAARLAAYQPVCFLTYDRQYLYIATITYVPDSLRLKANSTTARFSWSDDLIQVFLEPDSGYYIYYTVNSKGFHCSSDAFNPGSDSKTNLGEGLIVSASNSDKYWTLEMAIPWKNLKFVPKAGKRIGFNIVAYQNTSGDGWISWAALYGTALNTERFGYLVLGETMRIPVIPRTPEDDNF